MITTKTSKIIKKERKGSHETIEEAAKKNTEIKNMHPEDNNRIPNNTKKVKTLKNNQVEKTTAIAKKEIKPTSMIILEAMKQGTKINK